MWSFASGCPHTSLLSPATQSGLKLLHSASLDTNDPEEYGEYMFNEGLTLEQKGEIDKNTKRLF